jgi:PAS domain S-box-containing protein
VDDRAENLRVLEMILDGLEGVELVRATSGEEALQRILEREFAVVLLDARMPGMDGFETAATIRRGERSKDLPIIFVTALDLTPEQVSRAYSVGAVDFIFKPMVPEILRTKVRVFVELMRKTNLVRRQVEELRRAEERFRAVAETATDAIISGDRRGVIIYFNRAAEQIFGYAAAEVLGKPLTTLMPGRYHGAHREGLERYLATGQARAIGRTLELSGLRKDGSEFPVELSLAAWKEGEETFFTAILRDIRERKRAEQERERMNAQLLQGQKLQAIGQLAAGIAHEINNPAGYILSNLGTMAEYFADLDRYLRAAEEGLRAVRTGEDAARLQRTLESLRADLDLEDLLRDLPSAIADCRHGAEKIRDIVKSLREFTHPDDGERSPADLNGLVENAIRLCWNELKYKVELKKRLADLPPVVCQPRQIEQVVVNLLVNAGQAIGDSKGEIFVSTGRDGDLALLRIRDTGCGIAPEHLDRLFEPFFTTKPVGKGTGLGLYLVRKIVKGHGGAVDVCSQAGAGTEFTVRLPFEAARNPAGGPPG